jgi:adhesin/invasin
MLGAALGSYVTTAALPATQNTPQPVVFTATGVDTRLALAVPPPAIVAAGVALDPQPVIQLRDLEGHDVAQQGVTVTARLADDGTVSGGATAASDAAGRATFAGLAITGSNGSHTLIFTADGFASATATVALGIAAPGSMEAAAGGDQSAMVATAVAVAPAVLVRDQQGNPLAGIPVTFAVTGGGGSVSQAVPVTGADGVATLGGWTLGPQAGANTVAATISGLQVSGSPVTFMATGMPSAVDAAKSSVSAVPAAVPASGGSSPSTITVTARDALDNPIPGLAVTLAATGDGAALTQPDASTGSDGTATGVFSATAPGEHVVSATIAGVPATQTATITVSVGAPSAGRSRATVPAGVAGEGTTIEVQLKDGQGNDVVGQAGAIAVSVSGANPAGALDVAEAGGGRYTAAYTPTGTGTDHVDVKVAGTAVQGSPFVSAVEAGAANAGTSVAVVPACVEQFRLPARITITAFDAFGNRRKRGGDPYRIQVNQGPLIMPEDQQDGTYTAALNLPIGVFRVDITLQGAPIHGNPFQIIVPYPFFNC